MRLDYFYLECPKIVVRSFQKWHLKETKRKKKMKKNQKKNSSYMISTRDKDKRKTTGNMIKWLIVVKIHKKSLTKV